MVSVNRNPAPAFYFFDPMNMGLPGLSSAPPPAAAARNSTTVAPAAAAANTTSFGDDPNKKIRKPYTITKSRESWTDQEHDKFLEALQLFDRDWKKIEAFVGSKTVIQIRSHAQKYFLKVQKSGTTEHVPPPRPKRKAAHPYPQKAPKNAPNVTHVTGPFQSSAASLEPGYIYRPDSSSVLGNPVNGAALPSWSYSSVPPVNVTQVNKDDGRLFVPTVANNSCYSSSTESTPRTKPASEIIDPRVPSKAMRVMPDFAQVYSFIGSVFDPNATGHLQRLKQMDPINLETALLLMRNLSVNLMSPEFEDLRKLLSSYDIDEDMVDKSIGTSNFPFKSENAILSA
ncbi:GAMYB transcription factor [Trema orientale]|uniref:GAMYB transcription factor n=1 Tax=Trema orientale TaxID=63057 RepID=A0A2P5FHT0_TREOI|nr:GAMYB transcription factor [Trema orientale]